MLNPKCANCFDTGWTVLHSIVCGCRAGDHAWAKWEGMTIEEYDAIVIGTPDYHGPDPEPLPTSPDPRIIGWRWHV